MLPPRLAPYPIRLVGCRRMVRRCLPLLLLAQAPVPPPNPPQVEAEVVVTARTRDAVEQLVRAVTQTERGKQIARWNDTVCPRAIGIDPGHAAYVAKRIGAVARQIKVRVGRDACRPNVVVVFSDDATAFAEELLRRHPRLFGDPDNGLANDSQRRRLLQPRPVRWLGASQTRGPHGVPLADRLNPIYSASRLIRSTQEDSTFVLILVDVAQLHDLTWGQVSAYLAMVALARPDTTASFGEDTILSVFERRGRGAALPSDMTRADVKLLTALYATNAGSGVEKQRADIRTALTSPVDPQR